MKQRVALPTIDSSVRMLTLGDHHNFGAAVREVQSRGRPVLLKPRTVYWELLFFGRLSPLREHFLSTPIEDCFAIESVETDLGLAIKKISQTRLAELDFERFGFLLGYCFAFGLQDIHAQNVIATRWGLQPIDIEVVFSDIISPSQTQLVAGPNIAWAKSALGGFVDLGEFDVRSLLKMLNGFSEGLTWILKRGEGISATLDKESYSGKPNRVIFRDSSSYKGKIEDLLSCEAEQLRRNDIPYFSKMENSTEVQYLSDSGRWTAVTDLPKSFLKKANVVGFDHRHILSRERMESRAIPMGILSLAAQFRSLLQNPSMISLSVGSVELKEKLVLFTSKSGINYELRCA